MVWCAAAPAPAIAEDATPWETVVLVPEAAAQFLEQVRAKLPTLGSLSFTELLELYTQLVGHNINLESEIHARQPRGHGIFSQALAVVGVEKESVVKHKAALQAQALTLQGLKKCFQILKTELERRGAVYDAQKGITTKAQTVD